MNYEKFNVSKPRKFIQNGEEKTIWDNVGKITIFTREDGTKSGKLELFSFASGTIELNVFPFKEFNNEKPVNQNYNKPQQALQPDPPSETPIIEIEEEIPDFKPEDIPF